MKKYRKHIYTFSLIIAVAGMLLGRAVTWKMWDYLQELDAQISEHRLDLQSAEDQIKKNAEYVKKWAAISDFQWEPIENRQAQFTAYLNYLEAERNFVFDNINPPAAGRTMEESSEFQVLSYTLTFSCDLEDLVEFLDRLDHSEELLKVERLEISKRQLSSYRGRYESWLPGSRQLKINITVAIPAGESSSETEESMATIP